jgi:hypothetical protein
MKNSMKKSLFMTGIVILALIVLIRVFPILNARLESPKWTKQGQIKSNILLIVSRVSYYVETKHLNSSNETVKQQFLADKETVNDLSSLSLSVIDGKIIDSTGVTYQILITPPNHVSVTSSDGQKFGIDIPPYN